MEQGFIQEGFIYGIMALGVFITFRVLDFPDLTVDGSFPLGAALMAVFIINGYNLWLALFLAFLGGVCAGVTTALIHNKLKVPNLLAGILTMIMLYSVNLRILGRPNLPLMRTETILSQFEVLLQNIVSKDLSLFILFFIVILIVKLLLDVFFRTDLGLVLGALGNNQQMIVSQGINPEIIKIIGVGLSNGLVALSGAFAVQYQGFADVGLGQGIIIAGLASVMIGEFIFRSNKIYVLTLNVVLGSIIYRFVMWAGRKYGYLIHLNASDLKLVTGILVIVLLAAANIKKIRIPMGKKNGKA
ncbi:MAG: ABC transporter permease [Spirochaetales bacterium]|nr:ABC transporter permease [Spirochaetales bacterium]